MSAPRQQQITPLLRTKLHRPPVAADIVGRRRLHERLNPGLQTPLTVVSAPAGYGKSTLVSQWAESLDRPCAWLSLDEEDGDLRLFSSYLVAAVQTVDPAACPETEALLGAHALPPIEVLAGSLANELDEFDAGLVLVLDDYHRIAQTSGVHELLNRLLEHPPRPLRLVIVARRDPPLPLAALRAGSRLAEARLQDLRFTGAEISALLAKSAGLAVSDEALANLELQTEGWAAGLRLAILALSSADDPEVALKGLAGGVQQVRTYLSEEVIARQPPETREWLLKTSILERFRADLCEYVCRRDGDSISRAGAGEGFVRSLVEGNLFIIDLDADGRWFRLHHLFQDILRRLLRTELTEQEVATLHTRASTWFAENGLIDEALRHALAGGDVESAVRLVAEHRHELLNSEQWPRLERWLALLPHDVLVASPVLMSTMAYVHDFSGRQAEAWGCCEQAAALLSTFPQESPDRKAVEGETATMRALRAFAWGDGKRALELAERALVLLPPEALQIRAFAVGWRALAHQTMGHLGEALGVIHEALAARSPGEELLQVRLNVYLCLIHMMAGSLDDLATPARRCLALVTGRDLSGSTGSARYFLGVSHYLRNELREAEQELAGLLEDRYSIRTFVVLNAAAVLACVYQAQGRTAEAVRVMELAITQTTGSRDSLAADAARAFEVDLAARQGRIADARRLSMGVVFESIPPLYFFYVPQLTPVKLLLAEKTPESLEKAGGALDELDEFVRKAHRTTVLIDVLSLQALVLAAQGEETLALEKLAEALALAAPGSIVRSFLDLGPPMAELLQRLARQTDDTLFIRGLLTAFEKEGPDTPDGQPAAEGQRSAPDSQPLLDPLTTREQEVLELLAQRLRDKEIAEKLFVSPETVNSHLKHIYQKLGVRNRRQAVARATELGLLSQH